MSLGPTARRESAHSAELSWPQGVSHRATMTIGQLLEELKDEFPQISVSKLRFLENEGLITPERTGSGYRKYSPADVVRFRYILTAQRDNFWPLRVIREKLAELDAGEGDAPSLVAPLVAMGEQPTVSGSTMADIAAACGLTEKDLEDMALAGLLRPDKAGRLDAQGAAIVRLVASLGPFGIEHRHLRPLLHAVAQESELIGRATEVWRRHQRTDGREEAAERAGELAGIFASLHAALLRRSVREEG